LRSTILWTSLALLSVAILISAADEERIAAISSTGYKLIGWNDLGMHCVDGNDYSIFSILPPYNNVHAQLIDPSGKRVKDFSRIRVTYSAVADPDGSINRSSAAKTNFWDYVLPLYGASPAPDMGLAGSAMPGTANTPKPMQWDSQKQWLAAEGIPITPYDDKGAKNYYPLMRLTAKNTSGSTLATADVVLPVSDEMDCKTCHASNTAAGARPAQGWSTDPDPNRAYKWNILRLHDEKSAGPTYLTLLSRAGFSSKGLVDTVEKGTPVLCAKCHGSNALPGTGYPEAAPLTRVVHAGHANAVDPTNNMTLDAADNRSACYRCHPGSETKCLRGAMGNATAPDGTMLMQCQSCHGSMSQVGSDTRRGWLDEPGCEQCHTGTATKNSGAIRFASVFTSTGQMRAPASTKFAVNTGKLYRMSAGHGGMQCEACHGSTHAEYPSSHRNDNLMAIKLQGRAGTIAECTACHSQMPETVTGGPHGLHPIGQYWVGKHEDAAEHSGTGICQDCHGTDYRGTVLSAALTNRSFRVEDRTVTFAKGQPIGCYNCHNGPNGGDH
jgi:hypothetical protein